MPSGDPSMAQLLEFLANGLFLGAIYALLALPMSVVWVTTDVIDVATGGYAVVAGMVAVSVGMPLGPVVGVAAALALGVIAGLIFLGFHALRADRDSMLIVLATFALMMAIESAVLTIVGTDNRFLDPLPGNIRLGAAVVPYQGIFNLVAGIVIMLALTALLKWTPLGLRMRASAISYRAATLSGVAVRRTQLLTFVFCAGIAGVAGVLAAMAIGMTYTSTFVFTTVAFSGVVLLGRSGPMPAFIGGLLLGIATSVSDAYLPNGWAAGVPALLIILTLASGRMPATAFTGSRP
jgi:branched-chain amino acid transport system permease protein